MKNQKRFSLLFLIPLVLSLTPLLLGSGGSPSGCSEPNTVDAGVDSNTDAGTPLDGAVDGAIDAGMEPYVPFCKITLTGYFNESYTCAPVVVVYNGGTTGSEPPPGRFLFKTSAGPIERSIGINLKYPGDIALGIYRNDTGRIDGSGPTNGITIYRGVPPGGLWGASPLQGPSSPMVGLYTMNITTLIPVPGPGLVRKYLVHGTIDATLPELVPANGTPQFGTVYMQVEF